MHDQVLMSAKSKFSSIETLISQALIDMNISHKEIIAILKEIDRYEKMKENIREKNENQKQEIIKLSSIKWNIKYNQKKLLFFSHIYKNVWGNKKKLPEMWFGNNYCK